MKQKFILFDLDGTLLPLEQSKFTNKCFSLLSQKLLPYAFTVDHLKIATYAMVKNDGSKTNKEAFWDKLSEAYGSDARKFSAVFDEFYAYDFDEVKSLCGFNQQIPLLIKSLKEKGFRLAIATSPLFPKIAIEKRIAWSGLKSEDFELVTSYETSHFSKPSPAYYLEVLKKLNAKPNDCLMIGNDAVEDLAAESLGIKTFLLTDCLINSKNLNLDHVPCGNVADLEQFVEKEIG